MKLYDILKHQLKNESDFVSDKGELNKWVIIQKARNFNPKLLTLLLAAQELKETFFVDVDTVSVFKLNEFIEFLEQKNYLNDSYTQYKNKIGLTLSGKYIKQQNDIALVWPFKDCILEGGQSRSEQKREEIFFNEILAQDEITQLLEPKVLTNASVCSKEGKHHFQGFVRDAELNIARGLPVDTITDNLIMKGNNLLALYSLKKEFTGKVKLIYIDPPYNTGNDSFQYNDSFQHSTWLTFMKNRLEIAKELLHKEGAIFVQCDDKEQSYLRIVMDEIFGNENHRETIVIKTSTPSGVNAINVKRGERLFKVKEYLLFYSKMSDYRFNPLYIKSKFNRKYHYEVLETEDGPSAIDLRKKYTNKEDLEKYALSNFANIYSLEKNNKKAGAKLKKVIADSKTCDKVLEHINTEGELKLIYQGGVFIPLKDRIISEKSKHYFGTLISDLWDDEIFQTNSSEGGVSLPGGKKPEKLIKRILDLTTVSNDIVLDYHLGSGTTAAVAHKMGRQYIGVEQLDYEENDSLQRLYNVVHGDQSGISTTINWKGGGEFIYLELKKWNQLFMERIASANNTQSLLILWSDIKSKGFLRYNVDIKKQDDLISEFKELSLAEQKSVLCDILDKNQLYVNLSALQDKDFSNSEAEVILTKQFYNIE